MKLTKTQIKVIAICSLAIIIGILIYNVGADKRTLINVLEYRGYTKCADGIYRVREIKETDSGLVMIDRSFDIAANHGGSKVTVLFERVDHKLVKESEVIELGYWDYDAKHFEPINWGK